MPVTLLDWIVPVAILLCGLAFVAIRFLGFATARWGHALCCLAIGYALMLIETDRFTPVKQIVEDGLILLSTILAARALRDRLGLRSSLPLEITVMAACAAMVVLSLALFRSVRLETLCVQACCAFTLWMGSRRVSPLARTRADRILSGTFLLFAMALAGLCLLYVAAPQTGPAVGAWRTSIWGNLVQYTGLICSIVLAFAVMIATSFDLVEKYRRHANTDPLTGLLNRRGLDALLASPQGSRFAGAATAVILADIDRFKSINDRFGHAFGDRVLTRFGALLQAQAGARGCVVRLGGEEFAILLSAIRFDEAIAATDGMRRTFVAERWPEAGQETPFTASFGVTSVRDGEAIAATIERADHLLYAAKRAGRNCVVGEKSASPETDDNRLVFVGQPAGEGAYGETFADAPFPDEPPVEFPIATQRS